MTTRFVVVAGVSPYAGSAASSVRAVSAVSHVIVNRTLLRIFVMRALRPVDPAPFAHGSAIMPFERRRGSFGDNRGNASRPRADSGNTARRRVGVLFHAARYDHEVRDAALPAADADLRPLRRADDRDARLARAEHAFWPLANPQAEATDLTRAD